MLRKLTDLLNEEKKKKSVSKDKINDLLSGKGFVLFFTKGDNVFGAPEESRIIFSKMKTNDNEFGDELEFSGVNLMQALLGQEKPELFSFQDIPHIKVIDQGDAENHLSNFADDAETECGKPATCLGGCGNSLGSYMR